MGEEGGEDNRVEKGKEVGKRRKEEIKIDLVEEVSQYGGGRGGLSKGWRKIVGEMK